MAKKIIQFILVVIFIVFIFCAIVVGSYMLNQPSRDGESRMLINGPWICVDDDNDDVVIQFLSTGKFQIAKDNGDTVIADGYFKVKEDSDEIKLFMFPGHYDSDFEAAVKNKFFATISYQHLEDPSAEDEKSTDPSTVTLLVNETDYLYHCEMPEKWPNPYSKDKTFADFKKM